MQTAGKIILVSVVTLETVRVSARKEVLTKSRLRMQKIIICLYLILEFFKLNTVHINHVTYSYKFRLFCNTLQLDVLILIISTYLEFISRLNSNIKIFPRLFIAFFSNCDFLIFLTNLLYTIPYLKYSRIPFITNL